jgi:signal transduction histidine kinase
LKFTSALANLIAVTLDRQRRIEKDRAFQSSQLVHSQGQVTDLEAQRDLREKFVSTLSHDLRTPLTAARMCAQLIQKQAETLASNRQRAAEIVSNIDRVDQMIRDLLDANRIRAGEPLLFTFEHCDLRAVVAKTLELLRFVHGHQLVLESPEAEIWGYWNPDALQRLIENLVGNAAKYGSADRPITLSLRDMKTRVLISIHNEGVPIPAQDQKGLFKPFSRTDAAQQGSKKGWGLGLSLVQGIVDAHQGRVWVESRPGTGTTFTADLPKDCRTTGR